MESGTDQLSPEPPVGDHKSPSAFRTISEVADELGLAAHVLRFWESKFSQIKPLKRGGNRRYYRPADIKLLRALQALLHGEGYTIRGVQQLLKEQGVKTTVAKALGEEPAGTILSETDRFPGKRPTPQRSADSPPTPAIQPKAGGEPAKPEALKGLLSELRSLRAEME